ncbi:hypothetical protein H2198_006325 [Neophaeococcomyces mojaviensis]|uniref:Uncharacterized protein n=1 Tax=Neophaeococcomyces mojaviensis TaxID=3383035 RepID=A0ACC3A389_9EURO|nr:hypothetical protein H2198_006325 [Knufia sp. JES_112]
MDYRVTLTSLSPREAVADALHRCIIGIDDNNPTMFESACVKNESISILVGDNTIQGWTAVNEYMSKKIMPLRTTHFISNIRVDLKDHADTASMTAHAIAYHTRPEDAFKPENISYTTAGLYFMDLIRDGDDGLWKIQKWKLKLQWTEGDRVIITG